MEMGVEMLRVGLGIGDNRTKQEGMNANNQMMMSMRKTVDTQIIRQSPTRKDITIFG